MPVPTYDIKDRGLAVGAISLVLALASFIRTGDAPEPWAAYIDSAERLLTQLETRYPADFTEDQPKR